MRSIYLRTNDGMSSNPHAAAILRARDQRTSPPCSSLLSALYVVGHPAAASRAASSSSVIPVAGPSRPRTRRSRRSAFVGMAAIRQARRWAPSGSGGASVVGGAIDLGIGCKIWRAFGARKTTLTRSGTATQ